MYTFLRRMTDTMISQNIPPGAPSIFVNSSVNVYKLCKFLIFENAGYMTYSNDCISVRFALSIIDSSVCSQVMFWLTPYLDKHNWEHHSGCPCSSLLQIYNIVQSKLLLIKAKKYWQYVRTTLVIGLPLPIHLSGNWILRALYAVCFRQLSYCRYDSHLRAISVANGLVSCHLC